MSDRCAGCGRPRAEHCPYFAPTPMPEGCKCDPGDWGDEPHPICDNYTRDEFAFSRFGESQCSVCEHDKECHGEAVA